MTLTLERISKSFQKKPFDCGNKILNDFFKHYSFKNDQLCIGKTFTALDEHGDIAGYMTLSVSASIGLYAVIVDAVDEHAKSFYLKYGFIPFL